MTRPPKLAFSFAFAFAFAAPLHACNVVGDGDVQVFVEAEDTIPEGLRADGEEGLVDGWSVTYDRFLVTVGNFRAQSDDLSDGLVAPEVYVVNMLALPTGGLVIAEFSGVDALRWHRVGFDLPNATAESQPSPGVDDDDFAHMVDGGYSIYIEASLRKETGMTCLRGDPEQCAAAPEIRIAWGLRAGTSYDDCAPQEGAVGFAVPNGGTAQVKPTIHGDHWFFTNITQGAELTERRAQWIADCDLNRDGEVSLDELRQVGVAEVLPASIYGISGALIPVTTAYDFLEAQARTLGDFQGEGECPTRRVLE